MRITDLNKDEYGLQAFSVISSWRGRINVKTKGVALRLELEYLGEHDELIQEDILEIMRSFYDKMYEKTKEKNYFISSLLVKIEIDEEQYILYRYDAINEYVEEMYIVNSNSKNKETITIEGDSLPNDEFVKKYINKPDHMYNIKGLLNKDICYLDQIYGGIKFNYFINK